MKKKDTLFIYGGFRQYHYLYLIPLLKGYLRNKKIKNIIIENDFNIKILENSYYSSFLKNYNIIILHKLFKKKFILSFLENFGLILKIFNLIFFKNIQKKMRIRKKDFFENQLEHAVWDTGLRWNKAKIRDIELISKIKSFFLILKSVLNSKIVLKNFKIDTLFLAHRVYGERVALALFRKEKIKIFLNKNFKIDKLKLNYDIEVGKVNKETFSKTLKFINKFEINNYWKEYKKGKSNYLEARIAGNSKINKKNLNFKNVMFLHIFRDSPFDTIDDKRIFFDYYDWINSSLQIIKNSKENWLLREHPSAKLWGENSRDIVQSILNQNFEGQFPKNIKYSSEKFSNIEQFKNAKRIITFSGNSHLESGCFGIKPIIISNCTISGFNKKNYLKPKNIQDYERLLLKNSNDKIFKLDQDQINKYRRIIFIKQNLLEFGKDIDSFKVFYVDDVKKFEKLFKNILKKINTKLKFFEQLGFLLNKRKTQSINSKYLKFFE